MAPKIRQDGDPSQPFAADELFEVFPGHLDLGSGRRNRGGRGGNALGNLGNQGRGCGGDELSDFRSRRHGGRLLMEEAAKGGFQPCHAEFESADPPGPDDGDNRQDDQRNQQQGDKYDHTTYIHKCYGLRIHDCEEAHTASRDIRAIRFGSLQRTRRSAGNRPETNSHC